MGVAAGAAVARGWQLEWGATTDEVGATLTGDAVLGRPDLVVTRAINIDAEAAAVWPWIAQMGQSRGGLYSYDVLENLVGCDMHSADRIVTEWQRARVGDEFKLRLLVEPLQVVSFVMSQKMLRGIKTRAERSLHEDH